MYDIIDRSPFKMFGLFDHYDDPNYCLSLLYDPYEVKFQRGAVNLKDNGFKRTLYIVHDDSLEWTFMASKSCLVEEKQVPASKLYCISYEEGDKQYAFSDTKSYDPNQPCPYHEVFEEMELQEEAERTKAFSLLNDSKNFSKRISAKIINNELHIFYETYNYDKPELGEYYLMDYCRGTYHFSIADMSRFMTLYLTPEKYKKIYGKCNAVVKEQYDSLESLKNISADIPKYDYEYDEDRRTIRQKIKTFCRMKKEIDLMRLKLKFERAYIRSRSCLWVPIPGIEFIEAVYILKYYEAEKEFNCIGLDDLVWEAMSVEYYKRSKKRAVFQLSDGRSVKLNRKDLYRGYELGLNTIEEIGQFLLKYGKLSIRACMKYTS